jgi:PAS domain S-box-containing protein
MRQVAIVFTDISERKQAEAILQQTSDELERQVRKFDATLSTITDLVFSFDRNGRFLYANQVLLDLWGVTAAEAIGKTMADLNYPPTVERQVLSDLQQVDETEKSVRNETPYINPAGVEGYFEYILIPFF